jgi:hypothetical protein
MKITMTTAAALAALSGAAFGQVRFNEVAFDVPSTDNGNEFIELKSDAPSFDLSGLTIIDIEGDGTGRGVIDRALSLSGRSTGTNSLFLWRDSAVVLQPPPAAETVVFVQDFVPDLENGAKTYIIVTGFTGTVGQDLDTNDDGVLDITPWTSVVDAFGWGDNNRDDDAVYAVALGGVDLSDPAATNVGFTPDCFVRINNNRFGFDVLGAAPGPWISDPVEVISAPTLGIALPADFTLTPGNANPTDGETGCPADFNGDQTSDFFDYLDFVAAFDAELPTADFNGDNSVDFFDYLDFVAAFDIGC